MKYLEGALNPEIARLRAVLVAIQHGEEQHGIAGRHLYANGKRRFFSTTLVCWDCPSQKACRRVSLELARVEAELLGGGV